MLVHVRFVIGCAIMKPSSARVYTAPVMSSELWQRLRQARRFADLTQADLAGRCGVSRGAVALWEAAEPEHRTRPTTDHLIQVAGVCNVPLEWLLNDASDLDAIWRLQGEFGDQHLDASVSSDTADVLPDLPQGRQLFVFAKTAEQIASKLEQLAKLPPETEGHLILVGTKATVHAAESPADALSVVVRVITQK